MFRLNLSFTVYLIGTKILGVREGTFVIGVGGGAGWGGGGVF